MKKIYLLFLSVLLVLGVSAQTLSEDFESTTFPPTGWSIQSPDGGTGWARVAAGLTPIPGWQGGVVTTAPVNGGMGVAFCTWTTGGTASNDQYLITKQFTPVTGDFFNCWIRKFGAFADNLVIKVSITGNQVADFTSNLDSIHYLAADSGYQYVSYDLSNFVGQSIYIAFRETVVDNVNDGAAIFVDNVHVGTPSGINGINRKVYVNVFPNPSSDYVNVNLNEEILSVKLSNAIGQQVYSREVNSTETRIETRDLDSGLYILSIETAGSTINQKIYIVR
jgi:hypothetical protein